MAIVKTLRNPKAMIFMLVFALMSLPGAVAAGDEGCVTCHAGPMALNTLLPQKVEGHPDVGMMVNTVPTDCVMCHAAGTPLALMEVVHGRHEGVSCDNCHVLDAETGMPASIKSAPKNW